MNLYLVHLYQLRAAVGRYGGMDRAGWSNTKEVLGTRKADDSDLVDPVLESYREGALEQVRRLWSAFADQVDDAIDKSVR